MHFLNPDGQTGFGMPFENHLTDSYLVSSKGYIFFMFLSVFKFFLFFLTLKTVEIYRVMRRYSHSSMIWICLSTSIGTAVQTSLLSAMPFTPSCCRSFAPLLKRNRNLCLIQQFLAVFNALLANMLIKQIQAL